MNNAFAEIIASDLRTLTAQCWNHEVIPSFGSLVGIPQGEVTIWGIVTNIQTGSQDAQRYPFPYQKTEAQLKADHPQIFDFLTTTFTICVIGHTFAHTLFYTLAPRPAKIHSFVHAPSESDSKVLLSSPAFLPLLFAMQGDGPGFDEILLALCQYMAALGLLNNERFEEYYNTFSLLIGNDYRRLKLLLRRVNAHHARELS